MYTRCKPVHQMVDQRMTIVTVANQKGGVGKTTTVVTLGAALAASGRRVLLIDLDPQGHIAAALGFGKAPGLFRLLAAEEPLHAVTVEARPGLDIVPSDKKTERAKRLLATMDAHERPHEALSVALQRHDYDVVLIDTAPSLDTLHVAALAASDWLLVPTRLDHLALDGVNEVIRTAAEVEQLGYPVQLLAVVPTMFDRVTVESGEQLRALVAAFGERVWPPIPSDTKLREAPAYGQTAWEYAPNTPGLLGYLDGDGRVGGYRAVLERLERVL